MLPPLLFFAKNFTTNLNASQDDRGAPAANTVYLIKWDSDADDTGHSRRYCADEQRTWTHVTVSEPPLTQNATERSPQKKIMGHGRTIGYD